MCFDSVRTRRFCHASLTEPDVGRRPGDVGRRRPGNRQAIGVARTNADEAASWGTEAPGTSSGFALVSLPASAGPICRSEELGEALWPRLPPPAIRSGPLRPVGVLRLVTSRFMRTLSKGTAITADTTYTDPGAVVRQRPRPSIMSVLHYQGSALPSSVMSLYNDITEEGGP